MTFYCQKGQSSTTGVQQCGNIKEECETIIHICSGTELIANVVPWPYLKYCSDHQNFDFVELQAIVIAPCDQTLTLYMQERRWK